MTKVYANQEVAIIVSPELVEELLEIQVLRQINPLLGWLASKELANELRETLGTELLVAPVIIDAVHVAILTVNILADDQNEFSFGQDEYGYYVEV